MRSVERICDDIDRLVDEQLAAGPQDDYRVNRYDRCWHCGRQWHGMPITERIADMYGIGVYGENYSAAEDDSRVLCRGSDFIGPMPAERLQHWFRNPYAVGLLPGELTMTARTWMPPYREYFAPPDTRRWWRLPQIPAGTHLDATRILGCDTESITMTVGGVNQTWPVGRMNLERAPGSTEYTGSIDVLTELAPTFGGTWEPLTAPGSTRHPDTGVPSHPLGVATSAPWLLVSDTDRGLAVRTDLQQVAADVVGELLPTTTPMPMTQPDTTRHRGD